MKGLIFMVIVTLVVLASFARPEKEVGIPETSTINKNINSANAGNSQDSSAIHYKKG